MKTYAFRATRGLDLKREIIKFAKKNKLEAGCILTCVGCLTKATIRLAGAKMTKDFEGQFEIVSLTGTLSKDDAHLHISLSDTEGKCIGGHMKNNCIVDTTAEVVIGELENYSFSRKFDKETGYDELVVTPKSK